MSNPISKIEVSESCKCDSCTRTKEFEKALKSVSDPKAVEVFKQVYEQLFQIEDSCDYTNVNLDGSWDSSPFKAFGQFHNLRPYIIHFPKWKRVYEEEK